jgi:hypothetical protein
MMNGIYSISQTPTFVSSYFFLSPFPVEVDDVNSVDVASLFSYAWWERRKRRRD